MYKKCQNGRTFLNKKQTTINSVYDSIKEIRRSHSQPKKSQLLPAFSSHGSTRVRLHCSQTARISSPRSVPNRPQQPRVADKREKRATGRLIQRLQRSCSSQEAGAPRASQHFAPVRCMWSAALRPDERKKEPRLILSRVYKSLLLPSPITAPPCSLPGPSTPTLLLSRRFLLGTHI